MYGWTHIFWTTRLWSGSSIAIGSVVRSVASIDIIIGISRVASIVASIDVSIVASIGISI